MKEIKLTQNKIALVDDEDYIILSQYKWFCDSKGYARRSKNKGDINIDTQDIKMHRQIMNLFDKKLVVDHISGDTLDNRRENLRICTNSQNSINRKNKSNTISGYKGVSLTNGKYWSAYINKNGRQTHIGCYSSKEEAAIAYNNQAIEVHGVFAKLNVILP